MKSKNERIWITDQSHRQPYGHLKMMTTDHRPLNAFISVGGEIL